MSQKDAIINKLENVADQVWTMVYGKRYCQCGPD